MRGGKREGQIVESVISKLVPPGSFPNGLTGVMAWLAARNLLLGLRPLKEPVARPDCLS
jgi:hypothetical protein